MALQRRVVVVGRIDGTVDRYPLRAKTEMVFERNYKIGVANAFSGDNASTNLYRLAWECERAQGGVVKNFEDWGDTVEALDLEVEEFGLPPDQQSAASPS